MNRFSTWVAVAVLTTGIGAGAACQRQPDVKNAAEQALDRENITGVSLDWDADSRVLHMKGEVDSDQSKSRAEQVVTRAVGTSGRVANELTLRGTDSRTADDLDGTLRAHVQNLYDEDPALKERDIDVDVNNGVVTLKGRVASTEERERAYQMASQVPGAREVVNALEIGRDSQPADRRQP